MGLGLQRGLGVWQAKAKRWLDGGDGRKQEAHCCRSAPPARISWLRRAPCVDQTTDGKAEEEEKKEGGGSSVGRRMEVDSDAQAEARIAEQFACSLARALEERGRASGCLKLVMVVGFCGVVVVACGPEVWVAALS